MVAHKKKKKSNRKLQRFANTLNLEKENETPLNFRLIIVFFHHYEVNKFLNFETDLIKSEALRNEEVNSETSLFLFETVDLNLIGNDSKR